MSVKATRESPQTGHVAPLPKAPKNSSISAVVISSSIAKKSGTSLLPGIACSSIEVFPPEHSADDAQLGQVRRADDLVGVLFAVVAGDADPPQGQPVEPLHPEHAAVVDSVDLAVDDVRAAAVDGNRAAVHDGGLHGVAHQGGAGGVFGLHACPVELGRGELHAGAVVLDHLGAPAAALQL